MRDAAGFQAAHVFLREINAEVGEAAEEDAYVVGADRHPFAGAVADFPTTLVAQPLNEGSDSAGRAGVDFRIGDIARAIRLRHRQGDDRRLAGGWLDTAF